MALGSNVTRPHLFYWSWVECCNICGYFWTDALLQGTWLRRLRANFTLLHAAADKPCYSKGSSSLLRRGFSVLITAGKSISALILLSYSNRERERGKSDRERERVRLEGRREGGIGRKKEMEIDSHFFPVTFGPLISAPCLQTAIFEAPSFGSSGTRPRTRNLVCSGDGRYTFVWEGGREGGREGGGERQSKRQRQSAATSASLTQASRPRRTMKRYV